MLSKYWSIFCYVPKVSICCLLALSILTFKCLKEKHTKAHWRSQKLSPDLEAIIRRLRRTNAITIVSLLGKPRCVITLPLFSSTDGQVTTEEPAKTCFFTMGPDWPSGRLWYCSAQECVGPVIRIVPSSILTSTRVTVTCILALGLKCSCLLKTALPLVTHHLFYQPQNSGKWALIIFEITSHA